MRVLTAVATLGPQPPLEALTYAAACTWDSVDVCDLLLCRLPKGQGRRWVVLDHASCHRSREMQQARPNCGTMG